MAQVKDLPHDLLAEKTLLGCLMVDGRSYDQMSDLKLGGKDFYHPQFGLIFDAITNLTQANNPIDYITVCGKLTERGLLEKVGGQSAVLEIVEEQASTANIYHYAKIVKDKSSLREIVRTAFRVADMGMEYTGKTEDFFQEVESSFFKLTNDAKSGAMVQLNNCLMENLKELEDTSRKAGEIQGLSSGYPELDKLLLGMQPGQLIILAARPAMGKTSLALNMAINGCEQSKLPVAIFSLEMLSNELSMRLLSGKAKVDSKRIRTKNFFDQDLRSLGKAVHELSTFPIFINDSGESTILDIQS